MQEEGGFSEEEAILSGYLHNVTFGGRNAEQLGRKEREGREQDLRERLGQKPGYNDAIANSQAKKLMNGTVRFSKFKKQFSGIGKQLKNNSREEE